MTRFVLGSGHLRVDGSGGQGQKCCLRVGRTWPSPSSVLRRVGASGVDHIPLALGLFRDQAELAPRKASSVL